MMRLRFFPTICVRIDDQTAWTPSVDVNLGTYMAAMDAIRSGEPRYYFRGIRRLLWFVWIETGETWRFTDSRLFTCDYQSIRRLRR